MDLHGFTEEEAERELLKARQRDNRMREIRAMYPRYEKKLKEVLESRSIQQSVDNLGVLIEAKSYDIDGGWAGEELNEKIAWMLTDDEYENEPDEYEGWYEEEHPDANEWYDRMREERYALNSYEVRRVS